MRDEIDTHYAIIENGQKRIKRLMKNIRGFSSAHEAFHPEIGNVVEAFEDTLMLAHNALKYGVKVNQQWESPLMANFDLGGLKQVFLNLILNAVHAMDGRGELTVTGKRVNGCVRISVKDTGSGISAADQKRIFEAFFTTKDTGTGLGLSIARRIVEKHHGSIWVASEPGRGSEFFVEIPEDFSVSNTRQG
jgi:signal transduction histidine kinase